MSRIAVTCAVAFLLVGSTAWGIAAGPGGKVYFSTSGQNAGFVSLSSLAISPTWTSVIGDNALLGSVTNFASGEPNDRTRSPEIMVSAGQTGWAALGMGLGYNSTPSANLMDLLRIQTNSDGTNTVAVLGDGRAAGVGNTSTYVYGFLDHEGTFSGHGDGFIVSNSSGTQYAVWDADADGDSTNSNPDYHALGSVLNYANDLEILGGKYLFSHNTYFSTPPGKNIGMVRKNTGGTYTTSYWFTKPGTDANDPLSAAGGIAAAYVKNTQTGQLVPAVFAATKADANLGILAGVTMFVDLNGNDNASEPGEQINILNLAGTLPAWIASNQNFYDLEIVTGGDGKLFLLIASNNNSSWGTTLSVMQLRDNGTFSGDWTNDAKAIARVPGYGGAKPGVPDFTRGGIYQNFEFDSNLSVSAVPEPATCLLIGTGLVGLLGYARRRRIK